MNRCVCGSTQVIAEAILIQRTSVYPDGSERQEWVGDELCSVTCAACSRHAFYITRGMEPPRDATMDPRSLRMNERTTPGREGKRGW